MNLYSIGAFLSVFFNVIISFVLFFKGQKNSSKVLFGFVSLTLAIWSFACLVFSLIPQSQKDLAFLWWQIGYVGAIFIPIFNAHFAFENFQVKKRILVFLMYFFGIILVYLNLFEKDLFLGDLKFTFGRFYYLDFLRRKNFAWLFFYIGYYWILLGYAFYLLIKNFNKAKGIRRTQLKYLLVGLTIGWIGGETQYLSVFNIEIYFIIVFSIFLTAIYPLIITYAIVRYRLMDIRVAITRAGIFLVLYTLVLGVPFYIGYKTNSWLWSTSIAVILATFGPLTYRILQRKAEEIILAQQRQYQKLLVQGAGGMVREHNLDRLLKLIVYLVKRIVKIEFAAIFLDDKEEKVYQLRGIRDSGRVTGEISFSYTHAFIRYVREHHEPFLYEELPENVKRALKIPLTVSLIIPSFIENRLLGFTFLGEKANRQHYTDDDINVFRILANQAALAIENSLFFEEFKKYQERLFTAEKLASIGGMADGVAHQIKNRLNHFSVASGELKLEVQEFCKNNPDLINQNETLKNTFEYCEKIADSLLSNVKRTDSVIRGILNFARVEEKETFFSHFPFDEIVNLSQELLRVKHEIASPPVEVALDKDLDIFGVKAQIMEAVYNVIDNCYEAIQEKFKYHLDEEAKKSFVPLIKVKLIQKADFTLIEISDNGIGVKEEDKSKIFAPFFTTKSSYKSGSGIGMYVVKRMIEENHHGKVWFISRYMVGARFFIRIPKKVVFR